MLSSASSSFRLAVVLAGALVAGAASAAGPDAAPDAAKMPRLSWGADARLRDEYYNGAVSLDTSAPRHEQNHLRLRTRVWGVFVAADGLTFSGRVAAEPRYWTAPAAVKQHAGRTGLEERFAIADLLQVQWVSPHRDLPVGLTIGRQEIQLGEGWLLMDGTPCDGSWTGYFDAIRMTAELQPLRTTLHLAALDQRARPGDRIGTLGRSRDYALTEQDERGVVLYATHKLSGRRQLDLFFLSKHDERVLANGTDADLFTTGARFASEASPHWHYSAQAALQWGDKQDPTVKAPIVATDSRDVAAWAVEGRLTWLRKDPRDHRLSIAAEYLSGDDPDTPDRDEMFDMLWGRWPRHGDVPAFATSAEVGGRYAQPQNLLRFGPEWTVTPTARTGLSVVYNALFAPEALPTRQTKPALFTGDGHFRGHLVRSTLRHRFSPRTSALLQVEALRQGDFYTRRDVLTFVRVELATKF